MAEPGTPSDRNMIAAAPPSNAKIGAPATAPTSNAEAGIRKVYDRQTVVVSKPALQRLGQLMTLLLAGLHPDPRARPLSLLPIREALDRWLDVFEHEQREVANKHSPEQIMRELYSRREQA